MKKVSEPARGSRHARALCGTVDASHEDVRPLKRLFRRLLRARPVTRRYRARPVLPLTFALALLVLLWPARALRSDNFIFYFPNAHNVVPLEVIETVKYLPLIRVLNLVGKVGGLQEKKNSLKVWFGDRQLELQLNEKRVRLNKDWMTLSDPVRVANGQWMVPVEFLTTVLPQLTLEHIEYQVGTNRIFIGNVKPSSFTVRLDQISNGARLTVQFTDKVTVRTAASNGKWILFLGDRPVEPLVQTIGFQDPYVSELRFDDQDGLPKLVLTPTTGGLNFYPSLAEGGKILLADVIKPPSEVPQPPSGPETATTTSTPTPPAGLEDIPATPPGPPLPVVVLDAGHGAEDSGAQSRDGLKEKDLVAQLVARVRLALLATKKYRIVLTRVGDVNPSFDERELAANLARAEVFLTFHAGNLGTRTPRVVVYAYHPSSPGVTSAKEPRAIFVRWDKAQEVHRDQSRNLAGALQQQFAKISGLTADQPAEAPVRALRSVDAPAVAIEIGSLSPQADSGPLTSPDFQQQISTAIVQGLEAFRGRSS